MVTRRTKKTAGPKRVRPLDYLGAVRDSRDLSTSERLVALMIMSHAGSDGRASHAGTKKLAEETDLSERTIKSCTKSLAAKGWLALTYSGRGGRGDRANEYAIAIPKCNHVTLTEAPAESQSATVSSQSAIDDISKCNGCPTDALRNASGTAPHHQTSDDDDSAEVAETPSDLVAKIESSFGVKVLDYIFEPVITSVMAEQDVSVDDIDEALCCWFARDSLGAECFEDAPYFFPGNPPGWLATNLGRITSAYIEAEEKLAAELGVPLEDFSMLQHLEALAENSPVSSQDAA